MRSSTLLLVSAVCVFWSGCSGDQKAATRVDEKATAKTGGAEKAASPADYRSRSKREGDASAEKPMSAPEPVADAGESLAKVDSRRDADVADELRAPEEKSDDSRRVRENQPQIQAGTLTAGSLNDHKNFDDYREYLSEAQQTAAGSGFPSFNLGKRVLIEVNDAQGNGVSDVQVTVTHPKSAGEANEGVLLDTWTRADGQAFFSTGFDAAALDSAADETFELTIRPPKGDAIVKRMSASQTPWVVELPDQNRQLPAQLDLALVVDTTSSMGDELNYLKVELDNIVARVHRMFPNVEQRYALICYRDEGDDYVVRNVTDFTDSLQEFRAKLAAQSAKGGGDIPEAMHLALENSVKLSWRQNNTARVMFLVADAPPHHPHYERSVSAVRDLRQKGVAVYPLAGSGVKDACEFLMRATAFLTRGQYLFLTDHSGVGNPHAKPHAPKYDVEPLNQLMIRMIASELSGKPVLATDIIATEESDVDPPPIPQEQNQSTTEHSHSHSEKPLHFGTGWAEAKRNHSAPQEPFWVSMWDSVTVRCIAAGLLIGAILFVDHRMRT